MKPKEIKEWRGKGTAEMAKAIEEERKKLGELKLNLVSGKVKNIRQVRLVKKKIATLLTLKKELEKNSKIQ